MLTRRLNAGGELEKLATLQLYPCAICCDAVILDSGIRGMLGPGDEFGDTGNVLICHDFSLLGAKIVEDRSAKGEQKCSSFNASMRFAKELH